MKLSIISLLLMFTASVLGAQKAESVLVNKGEKKLYLLAHGKPFRSYHVVFGGNPVGHKQQEGDERTPEGKYLLDYKKSDSSFTRPSTFLIQTRQTPRMQGSSVLRLAA